MNFHTPPSLSNGLQGGINCQDELSALSRSSFNFLTSEKRVIVILCHLLLCTHSSYQSFNRQPSEHIWSGWAQSCIIQACRCRASIPNIIVQVFSDHPSRVTSDQCFGWHTDHLHRDSLSSADCWTHYGRYRYRHWYDRNWKDHDNSRTELSVLPWASPVRQIRTGRFAHSSQ